MSMPFAAERFNTAVKVIAAILTLVIPSAPTGAAPSPILEQAARGIENHRKGDATICFVRKDGTPTAGLKVEAIQRTHDFAFGNLFRPRHYTNELYRARFLEMFNFIQLLEFNWGQYVVRVTYAGHQSNIALHLAKGQPNNWNFTLD